MNIIESHPINELGYNFIESAYLPKGEDEYYLRFKQNNKSNYRNLTVDEVDSLIHNRNTSDNWDTILVSDIFNTDLIKNCKFYGLVRIGNLNSVYKEFHNLRMSVGLYNSTII
ncbi:MAG: DUF4954 family protein, partial [Ferruginibacter sp.]